MPVIIEGPDNSGKSRLAKDIATRLGSLVVHAGPKVADYEAMVGDIITTQKALGEEKHKLDVFDRVACISESAYNNHCHSDDLALLSGIIDIVKSDTILIYCRPPSSTIMDFSTHVTKAYDTEDHMKNVIDNAHLYISRYDETFSKIPHLSYNWLDSEDKTWYDNFINSIVLFLREPDKYKDVTEGVFHVK